MLRAWLAGNLNVDVADAILQISAAITLQSHTRRWLARVEAQTRRESGDYAFHEVMDGHEVMCWMAHSAYIEHIRQGFANIPICYHHQPVNL